MESNVSQNNFFSEYSFSIEINGTQERRIWYYLFIKRLLDIIISILCLPFAIILIFIFSILIKLDTPGPVFYVQERVGQYGKYFKVLKLRSMYLDAEKKGATWAIEKDPRITRVGHFMRKTRIDELPQLINILKGEMTFIGPRPERPLFTAQFEKQIPGFTRRLMVKPGLTGLAQINGGYTISPKEKLQLDLYYIEHKSIFFDFKILFKTVKIILTGDGAR